MTLHPTELSIQDFPVFLVWSRKHQALTLESVCAYTYELSIWNRILKLSTFSQPHYFLLFLHSTDFIQPFNEALQWIMNLGDNLNSLILFIFFHSGSFMIWLLFTFQNPPTLFLSVFWENEKNLNHLTSFCLLLISSHKVSSD